MRGGRARTTLLLLVGIAVACDRNPYTGRLQSFAAAENEALADKAARQYRQRIRPYGDAAAVARVTRITASLVDAAKTGPGGEHARQLAWEAIVTDQPDTDVATFSNGKIFVPGALVRVAANDAELAAALGSAVARVLSRHESERMARREIGRSEVSPLGGAPSFSSERAAELAATQAEEADWVGLVLATRAGYDPDLAVRVFDRLGDPARATRLREKLPALRAERSTAGEPERR
jgi:predicted Zn-dependent protease